MRIGLEATRANKKMKTGTEWYAWHLLQQFKKIDTPHKFVVYYNEDLEPELKSAPDGFTFKKLPFNFKKGWTHIKLSKELITNPVDKFFATNAVPLFTKGEVIVTIHDLGFLRNPKLYHPLERIYQKLSHKLAIAKADKIITISETTKQDIIRFFPKAKDKIKVIHLGFNKESFKVLSEREKHEVRDKLELPDNYILYIGRLETKKNIQNLIKAYKKSKRQWPLVLAGRPGNYGYDEIQKLAKGEDDIILLGYVSQKNYEKLIGAASLFVLPSKFEGFGIPLLEAMASGVPIACSNIPTCKEVAKDCALFFDPNKVEDIQEKIDRLVEDKHLKQILTYKGIDRAKQFSWGKCARETLEYIIK